MNKQQWKVLSVVLCLMGATALLLMRVGTTHRLGAPGLRLVAQPTYVTGGEIVRTQSVALPSDVPGFTSTNVDVTPLEVSWLPQDTLFGRRVYQAKDGFASLLSVVLMGTDRTSIHKPEYCLYAQGWVIDQSETVSIPMKRPHPYDLKVMKLTTSKPGRDAQGRPVTLHGFYIYWFVCDKLLTPYHGQRMWWMALDLLRTGVLQRWAYVTYFTACLPGQEQAAYQRLQDFIAASVPEFQLTSGPVGSGNGAVAALPSAGAESTN